jgi:DDE superfamily endonuclease
MMRWCENPTSDGGRRPQRNGRPGPLAGAVRPGDGPGRRPVRQDGASPARKALVRGLLADLPPKSCWTIAEHAGDATPAGMQPLLARAVWTPTPCAMTCAPCWSSTWATRRRYWSSTSLGPPEGPPCRRGAASGHRHRRQGRHAQVAVSLAEATAAGHGVIDRELYLPQGWLDDPGRCRAAGVPDQRRFATKPELARVMRKRPLDAGVPAGWGLLMRSTVTVRRCAAGWRPAGCPRCWRSRPPSRCRHRRGRARRRRGGPSMSHRRAGCG